MRVSLGPTEMFSEGLLTAVDLRADDEVFDEAVVWRWGENLYAVRNFCSHQGGPLCEGRLVPRIMADREGGGLTDDGEVPVLRCPWHGWEYDPSTGRSIVHATARIKVWPVIVEDGDAYLELKGNKRGSVTAVIKRNGSESDGKP